MGVVVVLLFGVALYGTTFILPQFTQQPFELSGVSGGPGVDAAGSCLDVCFAPGRENL